MRPNLTARRLGALVLALSNLPCVAALQVTSTPAGGASPAGASLAPGWSCPALPLATVPWLGDPALPHQVYDGGSLVLQGSAWPAAGCTLVAASWDPGDGSPAVAVSRADPRVLELRHSYHGTPGTRYTALLTASDSCGHSCVDSFEVELRARSLDVEVNMAIDKALWSLHRHMVLSAVGGVPTGYWTSQNRPAATAGAAQALMLQGHALLGDASEDPYVEDVQRGLAHLETELSSLQIGPQPAGDPDVNGNGLGLEVLAGNRVPLVTGMVAMAFLATHAPNQLAQVGGADVIGRPYFDLVQDMLDAYAWGQTDAGHARGGWRYTWQVDGMNTACRWPALAGIGAEGVFGASVPQFVKDENLNYWVPYTQIIDGSGFGLDGRFGYISATSVVDINGLNNTASGLLQLTFDGLPSSDLRFVSAERFLLDNWSLLLQSHRIFGMQGIAAALRLARPAPISLLAGSFDWYGAEVALGAPMNGLARHLVDSQSADGSWSGTYWVTGDLATSWVLQILAPTP